MPIGKLTDPKRKFSIVVFSTAVIGRDNLPTDPLDDFELILWFNFVVHIHSVSSDGEFIDLLEFFWKD